MVAGGGSATATWQGDASGHTSANYSAQMGDGAPYQCTNSAAVTVQVPDHLVVSQDTTSTPNCPSGKHVSLRQINYLIEDPSNTPIATNPRIRENVPTNIVSSCTNSVVQTGATCTSTFNFLGGGVGSFTDVLSAGCPGATTPTPCGFTFQNQQWQWCSPNGNTSIGTIGKDTVTNSLITVNGNVLGFSPGTTFPK